jgi:hypothetical protein
MKAIRSRMNGGRDTRYQSKWFSHVKRTLRYHSRGKYIFITLLEDGTLASKKKMGTVPFILERTSPWTGKRKRRFQISHAVVCLVLKIARTTGMVIQTMKSLVPCCILKAVQTKVVLREKSMLFWVKFISTLGWFWEGRKCCFDAFYAHGLWVKRSVVIKLGGTICSNCSSIYWMIQLLGMHVF